MLSDHYFVIGDIMSRYPDLNEDEEALLDEWLAIEGNREMFYAIIAEENKTEKLARLQQLMEENPQSLQKFWDKYYRGEAEKKFERRVRWPRFVLAAAAVLIFAIAGVWLWLKPFDTRKSETIVEGGLLGNVQPAGYKAKLTLANGASIFLDNTQAGQITQQGNSRILGEQGQITYQKLDDHRSSASIMNTLSTPAGGFYSVRLPDGTFVALNASSSLTYPTSFSTKERVVELEGEGYFEVVKDGRKPFSVRLKNGTTVNVFGTHFNIKDYNNEPASKITLIEGRIGVTNDNQEKNLQPGQQAVISKSNIVIKNSVDTLSVLGWRNGYFNNEQVSIYELLREIERWYNVKIVNDASLEDFPLRIQFSRKIPVTTILRVLEETGKIKFSVQGSTITASPSKAKE